MSQPAYPAVLNLLIGIRRRSARATDQRLQGHVDHSVLDLWIDKVWAEGMLI